MRGGFRMKEENEYDKPIFPLRKILLRLALIIAMAIIVAAEHIIVEVRLVVSDISTIIAIVEATITIMKVLSPAACLLLDLSQPIIAESINAKAIFKIILHIFISLDQDPNNLLIGSS